MQFQVGQMVTWSTRGDKKHVGKVFAVIPPKADPVLHVGFRRVAGLRINFSARLRDSVSYLVLRPRTQGTKQDELCWPKADEMRTVEERDEREAAI